MFLALALALAVASHPTAPRVPLSGSHTIGIVGGGPSVLSPIKPIVGGGPSRIPQAIGVTPFLFGKPCCLPPMPFQGVKRVPLTVNRIPSLLPIIGRPSQPVLPKLPKIVSE